MPAPPAPGIVALDAIWEVEGQVMENTFNYSVTGTIDLAKLNAMAQTYATWAAAHNNLFSSVSELVKIYVADLTSSTSDSVEYNVSPVVDGLNVSGNLPNNVTFSLKRMTGQKGRSKRGRIYLIGLSENLLSSSRQEMLGSQAGNYVTNYGTLLAAQETDNGAQEVVYHKALGTGTAVIGYGYADLFLDSQRRRLPGHNRHR
jgi:hypothetical protein